MATSTTATAIQKIKTARGFRQLIAQTGRTFGAKTWHATNVAAIKIRTTQNDRCPVSPATSHASESTPRGMTRSSRAPTGVRARNLERLDQRAYDEDARRRGVAHDRTRIWPAGVHAVLVLGTVAYHRVGARLKLDAERPVFPDGN
jgi:hypothetical protein